MLSTAPQAGAAIGKLLLEVGKALGKAVVAGIGLELARAASGHVKKAVGPKDKDKARARDGDEADDADDADDAKGRAATAADVARIRRENAALREELEALKRELRKVPAETER